MFQNVMFFKGISCVVLLCIFSNGSAFKIFDAEPLLRGSPKVNLTVGELEDILNIDPGGEYTTMAFDYERAQYLGAYDNKDERCYNDHVRCLTSIMSSSRPVCGVSTVGVHSDFGSMCDLYLDNCKRKSAYWTVVDSGNCNRAKKIFIYDFNVDRTIRP